MDSIRTLLLARTHTVILDPDRVATASTRPARDGDVAKFEAELVELGLVMSLDLAMTIRRFPHQAILELREWITATLGKEVDAQRPRVPLYQGFPAGIAPESYSLYARRVLSWLATRPDQPCPWCARRQPVRALDPCAHLVCPSCWESGKFAGCPVCHRRVSPTDPFLALPALGSSEPVRHAGGELRILHLAFDIVGAARDRLERIVTRRTPPSQDDRTELIAVIDAMGPRSALWLPKRIPVKETMAIAVARLWMVAPDRSAMVRTTAGHLGTATDILRVAAVLMQADPSLAPPLKLRSLPRGLRRAVLEALDRLPPEQLVEDMRRHAGLWKRVGERLHPFERAAELPTVALAFAALRGTDLAAASFGPAVRERAARAANVRITDNRARVVPWAGAVEELLHRGDARGAAVRLVERPGELLRRVDQVMRMTAARQPDSLGDVLAVIRSAIPRGAPAALLGLVAHTASRSAAWPRRVFFPRGDVLRAYCTPDRRAPLPVDATGSIIAQSCTELVARAEARPRFARAVIDRGLSELILPLTERTVSRTKLAWPRGSELALPAGDTLRLLVHWEEATRAPVNLDLSLSLFDAGWRHVGTCDAAHPRVIAPDGGRAALHSGDVTTGPTPRGGTESVDLHIDLLRAAGARHAVAVVVGPSSLSFDRLPVGFVALAPAPAPGSVFEPRAVEPRFDLHGRAAITVPLTLDLEARRMRWLDVRIRDRGCFKRAGGYRAVLAHLGRDFADLAGGRARPTLWEIACVHAAARANTIYVRGADGVTMYRRRDGETSVARLGRLLSADHDGVLAAIPPANAPTWVALLRDDLAIPAGSAGYLLDARRTGGEALARADAADLLAELAPRA